MSDEVSIHAPRAGGRRPIGWHDMELYAFQSTPPARGATPTDDYCRRFARAQPAAPSSRLAAISHRVGADGNWAIVRWVSEADFEV